VDLTDQTLLAVQVRGVEFSVSFFANADPVEDGEFGPVNCVWVEGSVVQRQQVGEGIQLDTFTIMDGSLIFQDISSDI